MGRSVIYALANWMLVHCHYMKCACTRRLRLHLRWSYKLRVQAHYTIFQVFAKHNYLLSWWKDGRNFGRSQEVYALSLEFNLLYLVSLRKILSIEVHSWKPSLNQIVYISNRIKKMTRTPSAPLTILVQEMTLFCIYFVNVDIWAIVRECAKKKRKRRPWKNRNIT